MTYYKVELQRPDTGAKHRSVQNAETFAAAVEQARTEAGGDWVWIACTKVGQQFHGDELSDVAGTSARFIEGGFGG